ncbi:hypothetical protein GJQ54_04630 [Oceanospirillaceae bacterium ASx5O]|nr:hypothetical protein GJQ54_04630 [Oceanospirillaceae bacterium ASx5O]
MSEVIRNCPWGFKCDKQWQQLTPTADANVRFCTQCQKEVHWVADRSQLADAVVLNRCVAFNMGQLMGEECFDISETTMGKVVYTGRLGGIGDESDE